MQARTPTLAGEAYPECPLGSVSISPVFRYKAPVLAAHLIKTIPMTPPAVLLTAFPTPR